ncbi:hypothetical protein Tsubulata_037819 [Turnera subulata]|uniref:2-(3-amino-3-carboxypropyl)histidine synthase subunit 2 n=1 Tax=Turnera subulata TaxID=218843 RepID=A0A9Q0GED9_9ROSI|nr:hypothetical protein Tsubulata_037819 [Turnera subulata]
MDLVLTPLLVIILPACLVGIGGLTWDLPSGQEVEDYLLFWIGSDNSAFENVVLTFNGCKIVRYDAKDNCLVTDFSQQRRILKRRYFLVEKAKDANIVGILVGTLGVAGYLNMIQQMKDLITGAGKKVYTFVMGRPNPAKLANFPVCNVFIYVSCAQTALLDSKQFYAPVITPFEALLAFNRGSQWTGAYVMEFQHLINSSPVEERNHSEEARFSFMEGGYVEDLDSQEKIEKDDDGVLALANIIEKTLQLRDKNSTSLIKGSIKSGADYYLSTRTYHGLEIGNDNAVPEPYVIGRTGKASGGSQWTGAYVMEFQHLINSSPVEERNHSEEARFSFMQGGYVEDLDSQEKIEKDDDGVLALANITEKALQLRDKNSTSLIKETIKSGADYYLSTRTYHGLEIGNDNAVPEPYVIGRTGKASGYEHERS